MLEVITNLIDLIKSFKLKQYLYIDAWSDNCIILRNISSQNIILKSVITPESIKVATIILDYCMQPEEVISINFINELSGYNKFKMLIKVNNLKSNHYQLISSRDERKPIVDLNLYNIIKFLLHEKIHLKSIIKIKSF